MTLLHDTCDRDLLFRRYSTSLYHITLPPRQQDPLFGNLIEVTQEFSDRAGPVFVEESEEDGKTTQVALVPREGGVSEFSQVSRERTVQSGRSG